MNRGRYRGQRPPSAFQYCSVPDGDDPRKDAEVRAKLYKNGWELFATSTARPGEVAYSHFRWPIPRYGKHR
jgi:hypothetical protein